MLKPAKPASLYAGAARRVLARLHAELGTTIDPEALYGYEAMRLVLDAIDAAGRHANRRALRRRRRAARARPGRALLGTYSTTGTGDVSSEGLAGYLRGRYVGEREGGAAAPPVEADVPR